MKNEAEIIIKKDGRKTTLGGSRQSGNVNAK